MAKQLTCMALDDEILALSVLETYIKKLPFLELCGTFTDAIRALEYLQHHSIDLLFIDINMPDLSGIEFINSLRIKPGIVVTSAYPEYAAESYNFDAIDYLLKPIEFDRFVKAVNKAMYTIQQPDRTSPLEKILPVREEFLLIKTGAEIRKIKPDNILWIEATGNYVTLVLEHEKILSLMTMQEILEILPKNQFIRIHKSFIVALRHIVSIQRNQIIIHGSTLPVGRTYRAEVLKIIGML